MIIPIEMGDLSSRKDELLEVITDENDVTNILLDNREHIKSFLAEDGDIFDIMKTYKGDLFFAFILTPDIYIVHRDKDKKTDMIRFKDIKRNLPLTIAFCIMNAHRNNLDSKIVGLLEKCLNRAYQKKLI